MRRGLAIAFVVLSIAATRSQDAPPVIGSPNAGLTNDVAPSSGQELATSPGLVFEEVPASSVNTITRMRRHRVGPFERTRSGLRFVDVYFDRALAAVEERSAIQSNATLQLVLAVQMPERVRYFRLRPGDDDATWLLLIADEPGGSEGVRSVAGNRTTPVIDVQYGSQAMGANSGVAYTRHLLVDLQSGTPRVMAALTDAVYEAGGACNAFDAPYGRANEIGCRWDEGLGDFRCAETYHRSDTGWGKRRGTRAFTLGTHGRPTGDRSRLQALQALAQDPAAREGSVTHVPSLGPVTIVSVHRSLEGHVMLLGSPLLTEELRERFGARLHVAIVRRGQTPQVAELRPRSSLKQLVRSEFSAPWTPPVAADQFTPDGVLPTFHTREAGSDGSLSVIQLTVAEGRARAVYLLGVEWLPAGVTADALLVATDALTYNVCDEWELPVTAVAMTLRSDPFSAILEVEPANQVQSEALGTMALLPREPEAPCGAEVTVGWQRGSGFQLSGRPSCRPGQPPRRALIGSDGTLSSIVARVEPRSR